MQHLAKKGVRVREHTVADDRFADESEESENGDEPDDDESTDGEDGEGGDEE
jgi:hypothetical protein